MTKRSGKWCAVIALLAITGGLVNPEPAPAGDSAAAGRAAASAVMDQFGTTEGLRRRTAEPLTGGGTLTTIDGGNTGSAYLTQPSSTVFLSILVQPDAAGDLTLVTASQDLNFDGSANYSYTLPVRVSGVCANGVISCDSGTWLNCVPHQWQADTDGRVSLQGATLAELGGCYCVNSSCGPGLVWSNLALILKDLGGGAAGAIQQRKSGYVITRVEIDGPTIVYYGQDTTNPSAGGTGSVAQTQYLNSPVLLSGDTEAMALSQAGDPDSLYSSVLASFSARGSDHEARTCSVTRLISVTGPLCAEGVYKAALDKCEVPKWQDGSSNGYHYGLQISDGRLRIVDRLNSNPGNWIIIGASGTVRSTVVHPWRGEVWIETRSGNQFRVGYGFSATPWFTLGVANGGSTWKIPYGKDWLSLSVSGNSIRFWDTWAGSVYSGSWLTKGYYINPYCGAPVETFNDLCVTLENDPDCSLRKESVDGVLTYNHFHPTFLAPLPSQRTFGDHSCATTFTRNWWRKDREYHCTTNSTFSFDDAGQRVHAITGSTLDNAPTATVSYSDRRRDPVTGEWLTEAGTVRLPALPDVDDCQHVCKTRRQVEDTDLAFGGPVSTQRTSVQSWEFFYKTCQAGACPAEPGEEVLKSCACINEFAEATAILMSLDAAAKDMICSGSYP